MSPTNFGHSRYSRSYSQSSMNIPEADPGDVPVGWQSHGVDDLLASSASGSFIERSQHESNPRGRERHVPMIRILLENFHPEIVDYVGDHVDWALRVPAIPRIVRVSERGRHCCNIDKNSASTKISIDDNSKSIVHANFFNSLTSRSLAN